MVTGTLAFAAGSWAGECGAEGGTGLGEGIWCPPESEAAPWYGFFQGRKLIVEQAPETAQLYQLVPNTFCMDGALLCLLLTSPWNFLSQLF